MTKSWPTQNLSLGQFCYFAENENGKTSTDTKGEDIIVSSSNSLPTSHRGSPQAPVAKPHMSECEDIKGLESHKSAFVPTKPGLDSFSMSLKRKSAFTKTQPEENRLCQANLSTKCEPHYLPSNLTTSYSSQLDSKCSLPSLSNVPISASVNALIQQVRI